MKRALKIIYTHPKIRRTSSKNAFGKEVINMRVPYDLNLNL